MSLLIINFGGTSVGSLDGLRQTAEIVQGLPPRWVNVVVSNAMLSASAAAADGVIVESACVKTVSESEKPVETDFVDLSL